MINVLKLDPSRTISIRLQYLADLKRRFKWLRQDLRDLLVTQDAFGLVQNYDPNEPRDWHGRWQHGTRSGTTGLVIGDENTNLESLGEEYHRDLSYDEKDALGRFIYEAYYVRRLQKESTDLGPAAKEFLGTYERTRNKLPVFHGRVFRGLGFMERPNFDSFVRTMRSAYENGALFRLNADSSSSRSPVEATHFGNTGKYKVLLDIQTTSGRWLEPFTHHASYSNFKMEKEVILKKGSTYEIEHPGKVRTLENPYHRIHKKWTFFVIKLREVSNEETIENQQVCGNGSHDVLIRESQTNNADFSFQTDNDKIDSFKKWLKERVRQRLLSVDPKYRNKPWSAQYVDSAYRRGVVRSYTDMHKKELAKSADFYQGSKEQYLRDAFGQPELLSKAELLATRSFTNWEGISDAVSDKLNRIFADGIAFGQHPDQIAKRIDAEIDSISKRQATTMALTEVIHAHAEGQLDSFENLGVDELEIDSEWSTAGDSKVCPLCKQREGKVYSIDEARGLIPLHPRCRCAWKPYIGAASKADRATGELLLPLAQVLARGKTGKLKAYRIKGKRRKLARR